MKTILVSGANGIVGYGILKSLRLSKENYKLIGTTIYTDSVAPAFCDVFERAPMTSDPNYIDWLCGIVIKHNVDMIIPGIDADLYNWNKNKSTLTKTPTYVLLNNYDLIKLCQDKWLFYNDLKNRASELAISSKINGSFNDLINEFGLPLLLKPRKGSGSKGIVTINSKNEFEKVKDIYGSILMAQPIIGNEDEEYTVSAFFDKNHALCCYMSLRRKLSKEGYTEKALTADVSGFEEAISELANYYKPIGPTNFQFRIHNQSIKLLEINPRISSATSIRAAFDYNESDMSVRYFLDNEIPRQPFTRAGLAVRYVEEYIFYDRNYF